MPLRSLALVACLASAAAALPVPYVLSHQGRVLDASDANFTGTLDVTFALHESADPASQAPIWSEHHVITVVDGAYAVLLGDTAAGASGTAIPAEVVQKAELWLSLTVDGSEMLPRQRLVSNPYALRAALAVTAERVLPGGVDSAAIADGAVTLAKLAVDSHGHLAGLDSDTLDGLDSSAFAPASLEAKIGNPPAGSSVVGELSWIRGAVEGTRAALGARNSGTVAGAVEDVSASVSALSGELAGVKASLGSVGGSTVAARADAAATSAAAANAAVGTLTTRVGAPAGASLAADVAATTTAVGGVNTSLTQLRSTVGTPAGASIAADLAALQAAVAALAPRRYSRQCLDDSANADSWQKTGWPSQQECLRDGRLHELGTFAPGATCAADVGNVLPVLKAYKAWGLTILLHLNDNAAYVRGFGNPHVNATDNPFLQTGEVYFWNQGGAVLSHVSNASDTCIDAKNCTIPSCAWWGSHSGGTIWVTAASAP